MNSWRTDPVLTMVTSFHTLIPRFFTIHFNFSLQWDVPTSTLYLFPQMVHSSSISHWPYNRRTVAAVELSLCSLYSNLLFTFPSRPFSETSRTTFDFFVLISDCVTVHCRGGKMHKRGIFIPAQKRCSKESTNSLQSLATCVWDCTHAVPRLLPPYKVRIVRNSWQRPSFTPI
jgi:hypothetical protein